MKAEDAEADGALDLVPRFGQRLTPHHLLDAATLGNWLDVEFTVRAIQASTAYAAILIAMAHLVAARRRLRLAIPILPPGPARAQAVRLAPECGSSVGDLRALIAPGAPDPTTETIRLCRLGDSLHAEPQRALLHYDDALRLIPDHAPAHFGVFIVKRALGDVADAAYHLFTAVQYAPGNAIYRYYYDVWRQADPHAAAVLPSLGSADDPGPPTERAPLRALRRGALPLLPTPTAPLQLLELDLHDPPSVRVALDDALQQQRHNLLLALAFAHLGRIDARNATQRLDPTQRRSTQIIADVAGLAHLELALGALDDARAAINQEGYDVRTRITTLDLCTQRLLAS